MGKLLTDGIKAFKGKKVLVVGLGVTGVAVSKFLCKHGSRVYATDVKRADEIKDLPALKKLGVEVETGGHTEKFFRVADIIVASPGVDLRMQLLKDAAKRGVEIISDIELMARLTGRPMYAVTGTNGKSTVTTLLKRVFDKAGKNVFMGGNIGTPVTEFFESKEDYEGAVLEISSFHLEAVKEFAPRVAVLLNITEDHLYRYESFDEYAEVKFRVFAAQKASDYAVINVADPVTKRMFKGAKIKSKVLMFSVKDKLKEGVYLDKGNIVLKFEGRSEVFPTSEILLQGLHNIENVMAVVGASAAAGMTKEAIMEAIHGFTGLPHRMEFVREINGVKYFNDSKGTNVGSLCRALEGFSQNGKARVIVIAGGKDKGGDYGVLKELMSGRVKLMVLIGEATEKIIKGLGKSVDMIRAGSMDEAVIIAFANAKAGDSVLLCPACSSFDMFKNYEERGSVFRKMVESL